MDLTATHQDHPSNTAAIKKRLHNAAERFSQPDHHLRRLLAQPDRLAEFSLDHDRFFMDFSCQRINEEVLTLLYDFALSSGAYDKFKGMVSGELANPTEKRAALHTAARGTGPSDITVAGTRVHEALNQVHDQIRDFSAKVHSGAVAGQDSQPFTHAVVVGIGGSYLGCEFVYQALAASIKPQISLEFLSNVDIDDFSRVISRVPTRTTLWIVVSKSYTTTETMANLNQVRSWLSAQGLDPSQQMVTITAKGSPGDISGNTGDLKSKVLASFHMFDFIGGRYSVSSAVGGLPLSLAYGWEAFETFLGGCRDMDEHTLSDLKSIPMTAACLSIWNACFLNYPAQAIIPYATRLSRLPAHIQQLHMESLGKSAQSNGSPMDTPAGIIIFGEPGTNAQHSFFQLAHQGPGFPIEFIGVLTPGYQGPQSLNKGVTNHQELWANLLAQSRALAKGRDHENPARRFDGNRPSSLIVIESLSPENIGKLLAFYEARTVLEGFMLGINPFDQFGVELGKTMAGTIREEMAKKNMDGEYEFNQADPDLKFYLEMLFDASS